MKFAHLADCHIGSWRDPKLNHVSTEAFCKAIDSAINHNVDFIVIAGDLFNTSVPGIDRLKEATKKLKELKDKNIAVYLIAGSHDFSPSGKTMLDVLEHAGLCVNVAKGKEFEGKLKLEFTVDKKTGAKITGIIGKRGGLEKGFYEDLYRDNLENEGGFKIFIFHSLISELKPKEFEHVDSHPLSLLPKNFNYYAGGHPHFVSHKTMEGYGIIAYPGPLFPNNFRELEKLEHGGFYIYEDGKVTWEPIRIYNTSPIIIKAEHKTAEQVEQDLLAEIKGKEFINTIITLRVEGTLSAGKPSDIHFKEIVQQIYDKGAYFIMRNTTALLSKEYEEIKIDASTIDDVEDRLVKEHLGQLKISGITEKEHDLTKSLMKILTAARDEGEKVADFEKRVKSEIMKVIEL